jgi:Flp pilus assembly protein TadD
VAGSFPPPIDPQRVLDEAIADLRSPEPGRTLPRLEQALRSAPRDARLWHVKGMILRRLERREEALPALERAAALAPKEPMIAHALARTLSEAGLPSLEAYAAALRAAPGDPAIVLGMAAAMVAEGQVEDAIRGLSAIVARSPAWVEGHVTLSQLRWMEGERDGFARSFDEALAVQPANATLRWQQITTLLHAEQFHEVLRVVAEGRRRGVDEHLLAANEAVAFAELGETETADRMFARIGHLGDATIDVRRVRHLLRSRRPEDANAILEPWLSGDEQAKFWPYAATTWRLLGDPRWQWLEGDPRFVGVYDIADRLPPLDALAETLRAMHTTRGQPLEQSVRGGTQTDGKLFHHIDPLIVQLREAVRAAVAEHAAQLPPPDPGHPLLRHRRGPIRFSGAWSVRLQAGGSHANHVHPQGWLSSALYIVLPPDLGRDQAGWLTLGEPHAQLKLDLPPARMVEPKPGRLALFPSTMWHGTRPFGSGERMTVAFDVAVPG